MNSINHFLTSVIRVSTLLSIEPTGTEESTGIPAAFQLINNQLLVISYLQSIST